MSRLLPARLNSRLFSPSQRRRAWLALWAQERRRGRGASAPPVPTLLDGLAAYWPLDEGGGMRYDAHFFDNDLTPVSRFVGGTPNVLSTGGIVDDAAEFYPFDDEETETGMRDLEADGSFQPNTSGDFSVAAWICVYDHPYSHQRLVCKDGELVFWVNEEGRCGAALYADNYATLLGQPASGVGLVSLFNWTQVAFVKSGNVCKIYCQGSLVATATLSANLENDVGTWRVGGGDSGWQVYGLLDEVGIWERALTAAEVSQLYNGGDGLIYALF